MKGFEQGKITIIHLPDGKQVYPADREETKEILMQLAKEGKQNKEVGIELKASYRATVNKNGHKGQNGCWFRNLPGDYGSF